MYHFLAESIIKETVIDAKPAKSTIKQTPTTSSAPAATPPASSATISAVPATSAVKPVAVEMAPVQLRDIQTLQVRIL